MEPGTRNRLTGRLRVYSLGLEVTGLSLETTLPLSARLLERIRLLARGRLVWVIPLLHHDRFRVHRLSSLSSPKLSPSNEVRLSPNVPNTVLNFVRF